MFHVTTVLLPEIYEYWISIRNWSIPRALLLVFSSQKKKKVNLVPPGLCLLHGDYPPAWGTWTSQSGEVMKNGLRDWQGFSCVNRIYLLNIDETLCDIFLMVSRWVSESSMIAIYLNSVSSFFAAGIGCSHKLDTGTFLNNKPCGMKSSSVDSTFTSSRLSTDGRCSCIYINAGNTLCFGRISNFWWYLLRFDDNGWIAMFRKQHVSSRLHHTVLLVLPAMRSFG